ncbi:MAG: hypothetical protein ACRELB_10580 [Polyangiaceae bacterium]
MSNAWDNAKQLAEKHAAAGGIFVRLQNDGDKVVGVFCGEPFAKEVYWDGDKYVDAPPEGSAPKPSLRVSLNFYVPTDGAMKIIEGGTAWFKDVLEVKDKYGLEKWSFEVKRRGKKGDPKTKYSILPDTQVDDALRARITAAALHDLGAIGAPSEADADAPAAEAPKTIDLDTARQLVERLRPLPREVATAFLAELKIERIRDLLSADLPRALRFIEGREKPAAVDPFAL